MIPEDMEKLDDVLLENGLYEFLKAVAQVVKNADHSAAGRTGQVIARVIEELAELEW